MGETGFIITLILFNVIFIGFIIAIVVFIRQYLIKKKLNIKELDTANLVQEIQLQTMKYIGREIHDNIGQKLTLSSLYLEQLALENKIPRIDKNINNINEIINESLQELRQLSKSLTDDTIEGHSISELLEGECKKINNLKKCHAFYVSDVGIVVESYQIKRVLFRITQEFLQNSIKHADCKNIFVSLSKVQRNLQLLLQDDGKGFNIDTLQTKGIGLKNIKKRAQLINGTFHLESQQNIGTIVTIEIPI